MTSQPVSLRISAEVRAAIDDTRRRTGRAFSSIANEMLLEAVKMRRIPGIAFADEPGGRVAKLAGTGLGVWEIIASYRRLGEDWDSLRDSFDWLDGLQLRAALAYAAAYPEEIEARFRDQDQWTPERVWAEFPFTRPPGR